MPVIRNATLKRSNLDDTAIFMGRTFKRLWRRTSFCWHNFLRATDKYSGAITAISTVALVAVTVALVVVGVFQYRGLKSTEVILARTEDSKRPWLALTTNTLTAERQSTDTEVRYVIRLEGIKNGGDMAATGVNLAAKSLKFGPTPSCAKPIAEAIKSHCSLGQKIEYFEGEIALPGETISLGPVIFSAPKPESESEAWIAGCVGYQASGRWHGTTFAYHLVDGSFVRIYGLSSGGY